VLFPLPEIKNRDKLKQKTDETETTKTMETLGLEITLSDGLHSECKMPVLDVQIGKSCLLGSLLDICMSLYE